MKKYYKEFISTELIFFIFTIIILIFSIFIFKYNQFESFVISLLYLIFVHLGLLTILKFKESEGGNTE